MNNSNFKHKIFAFLATILIMGQTLATPIVAVADELNQEKTELVAESKKEEQVKEEVAPTVTEETTDAEPQNSETNADATIGESANANDSPEQVELPQIQAPITENVTPEVADV